jgi:hypothetical protein
VTDAELAAAVANAAALVLGFPAGTTGQRMDDAAAAAVAQARTYIYGRFPEEPMPMPDPTVAPDVYLGLQALAVRLYHDPASPAGVVGGDAYTGVAIPEDLLAHVHHYFDAWRTNVWGIA